MSKRHKAIVCLFVLAVLALFLILQNRQNGDRDVAQALLRKQRETKTQPSAASETAKTTPTNWWLADGLEASKNAARETWFVRRDDDSDAAMIQFPFPPSSDGRFPVSREPDPLLDDESPSVESVSQGQGYVGAQACASCHQEKHSGFVTTAHFRTSGQARREKVQGHFESPRNRLQTEQPGLSFIILEKDERLYQRIQYDEWTAEVPMDVVTGSAKTGQTYLYWLDDALFQAHVTYMEKSDEWVPSPGFSNLAADYSRPIKSVCLECHVTYIEPKRPPNHYHRDTAIWGISCERCHGPGRGHVEYHEKHPEDRAAKLIQNPKELSRERQLDICAQCHSGISTILREPFAYRPGEDLKVHHQDENPDSDGLGGIHTSNQLNRLRRSECFQQTEMTCSTCHDPHQERSLEKVAVAESCFRCHESEHCGLSDELDATLQKQCVACHMPLSNNNDIVLQGSGGNFTMQMTDHFIRVDPEATSRLLGNPTP